MSAMASAAFDTFQAARALESAGVERAQAEAIANAIQHRQDYATKADLAKLATEMRSELRTNIAEIRSEMAALETRLTHRMHAIAIGLGSLIAAFGLFTWPVIPRDRSVN